MGIYFRVGGGLPVGTGNPLSLPEFLSLAPGEMPRSVLQVHMGVVPL